jgi:hypothetical protein
MDGIVVMHPDFCGWNPRLARFNQVGVMCCLLSEGIIVIASELNHSRYSADYFFYILSLPFTNGGSKEN